MAGEETELWPELENYPHTRFSKSLTFSRLQMESTLSLCAEGITLNLFDMAGNGVNPVQQYDSVLSKIKPYLTGVVGLGFAAARSREFMYYIAAAPLIRFILPAEIRPRLFAPEKPFGQNIWRLSELLTDTAMT